MNPPISHSASVPAGLTVGVREVCPTNKHDVDIQELTDFLLDYGINLMASGAYTARVVANVKRLGEAYGYHVDIVIFQKNMTMTVTCPDDYSVRRTYVRQQHPVVHISFRTISDLSALSWKAYDMKISFDKLREDYDNILSAPYEDWKLLALLTSVATAAFCRLFGGDFGSVGIVFFAALIGFLGRRFLASFHFDSRLIIMLTAFLSSFFAFIGCSVLSNLTETPNIAVATSVLYLVPGVHFINSVIDILDGHVLIGISRAVNTFILIMCIAFGVYFTLTLSGWIL